MSLTNAVKSTFNKLLLTGGLSFLALAPGCKQQEEENKYKGKTLDELISIVDTPKKAQQIINATMTYDNQRNKVKDITALPPNGALAYSGEEMFNRGGGICKDFAAMAIMYVKKLVGSTIDDLFYADVSFTSASGHSFALYTYKDENGNTKYGKMGQGFDYSTGFDNLWEAGEDAAKDFNTSLQSIQLFDISYTNWRTGTNGGFICYPPFLKEEHTLTLDTTATITPTANGYVSQHVTVGKGAQQGYTADQTINYNNDLVVTSSHSVSRPVGATATNQISDYNVLTFTSSGAPATAQRVTTDIYGTHTSNETSTYDPQDRRTSFREAITSPTASKVYRKATQYHQNNVFSSLIEEKSDNGTAPFDYRTMKQYDEQGNWTSYSQDPDGDNIWTWLPIPQP